MTLTDREQEQWRSALREQMCGTPFVANLGVVIDEWSPAGVRLRLPFSDHVTNDGQAVNGGAISSLIDVAGAGAVWAGHDFDRGMRAATVSMTVNFIGAARAADLLADAICVKRGRDLSFSEIRVSTPDGAPVANGTLVYRIVP
ncbi:MAG: PaaI family thioesterase [Acidimicrobiia bacterium]